VFRWWFGSAFKLLLVVLETGKEQCVLPESYCVASNFQKILVCVVWDSQYLAFVKEYFTCYHVILGFWCSPFILGLQPVLVQSRRMSLRRETGPFTEFHPQWLDWFIRGVYPCTPPPWMDWSIHRVYTRWILCTHMPTHVCALSWSYLAEFT